MRHQRYRYSEFRTHYPTMRGLRFFCQHSKHINDKIMFLALLLLSEEHAGGLRWEKHF